MKVRLVYCSLFCIRSLSSLQHSRCDMSTRVEKPTTCV